MKKKVLLSAILSVMAIAVMADEYTDPQTNVVYTYEPGQPTAAVKEGYKETIDISHDHGQNRYSGCPDATGDVVILDRFTVGAEMYVVTSIGDNAFRSNKNIKSVIIPESVTDIGIGAFSYCDSLTTVQLPRQLTHISDGLFRECGSLASLTLPDSLTFIGRLAFSGTPWYAAIYDEAPEGLFYIGSILLGYKGDKPRGELVIKEGTTCIGYKALVNCPDMTAVTFPESVAYVDQEAFTWCDGLQAVHITNLAAWCGIEFQFGYIEASSNPLCYAHHLYLNGKEVTDLVIPEGVTSIGSYAFNNCTSLTRVTLPDGVTSIGKEAFYNCSNLTSVTIPPSLTKIGEYAFWDCNKLNAVHISDLEVWCGINFYGAANPLTYGAYLYLNDKKITDLVIPEGITSIGDGAFRGCSHLTSVTIPASVNSIGFQAFFNCRSLDSVISWIEEPFAIGEVFELNDINTYEHSFTSATLYVPMGCKARYEATEGWKDFKEIVEMTPQVAYRPFVEEGKVWKVGNGNTGNPVQIVEYYYFDGDTIIGGKTCKQMMCQRFVSPDYSNEYWKPKTSLSKVGAWYEEDQKVYVCREGTQGMQMLYDFSLEANDTLILNDYQPDYIVGPKQTGGLNGFKGVYRDIMLCGGDYYITTWLEGVGGIDGPLRNVYPETESDPQFLMSCTVGDEVIYLNDEYEDGATPEVLNARKQQIDFTHTIKTRPKAPKRGESQQSLYGEYNALQLDINLTPLDDAYLVRITDETDKAVYEKTVNAGNIVGLNIDISTYAEGRYTVTVENSEESFTGVFETQTTGISDAARLNEKGEMINDKLIYNLQGQRISSLQKGLNIVNRQKVYIK